MTTELWIRVSDVHDVINTLGRFSLGDATSALSALRSAIDRYAESAGKPSPEPTESDIERAKLRREMALAICLQMVAKHGVESLSVGVPMISLLMADKLLERGS